jgi:putative membrane protein
LEPALRTAAALVLVATGLTMPAQIWICWARAERAIRAGRPLPAPIELQRLLRDVEDHTVRARVGKQ